MQVHWLGTVLKAEDLRGWHWHWHTHTRTAASLAASSVSNCAMRRLRSLVDVRCCCSSACTANAAGVGFESVAHQHAEAMHVGDCDMLLQLGLQQVQLAAVKCCCSSPCTANAPA